MLKNDEDQLSVSLTYVMPSDILVFTVLTAK